MKITRFVILVSCLLSVQFLSAQARYFVVPFRGIVDSTTYEKLKEQNINEFKKSLDEKTKLRFKEKFNEIRRTRDSIILTYSWKYDLNATDKISFDGDQFVGKVFPLPALKTIDGKTISIDDLKGKPSLINFWFANCAPCIDEMPMLNNIQAELKDKVNFIAITFETPKKVKTFLRNHSFQFTHIIDAKTFLDSLKLEEFPQNIFLDKSGIVRKVENGIPYVLNDAGEAVMGDGKEFLKYLKQLIEKGSL